MTVFRKVSYLLFIFAVFTWAASLAVAQQIQGEVRYSDSGQSVIGALVHCNGTGGVNEQLTDRSGKFYFRVSPGHYNVSVSYPGYRGNGQSVDLLDIQSSEYISLRLMPEQSGIKLINPPSTIDANVPSEAQKEFDKGEAALASDKKASIEEGVRHLETAIATYPRFLQAQLRLGTAYMDLRQWNKAEKALLAAIEINPEASTAYFALGEVYRREKKYPDAEKILLDGLKLKENSAEGHNTLAKVYWEMAPTVKDEATFKLSMENSWKEVKKALALKPSLADAHLLAGNLLLRVRRAQDALVHFEEYLKLDPKGEFAADTKSLVNKIKQALAQSEKK